MSNQESPNDAAPTPPTRRTRRAAPATPIHREDHLDDMRQAAHESSLPADERSTDGCNDVDAAHRLVKFLGEDVKYAPGVGWLLWDSRHWVPLDLSATNKQGEIYRRSAECAKQFHLQVQMEPFSPRKGQNTNPRITKAEGLMSKTHVYAAVEMAKNLRELVIPHESLDKNDWLLNCLNGTLDLRTGVLREHRREDYITQLANVEYHPEARHEMWDAYLARLEEKTPGMDGYLSRCYGCALTGDVSVESLFFILGDGASGKTTGSEAFLNMMGTYAEKTDFSTFTESRFGKQSGGASPEMLSLMGKRFVLASESSRKDVLNAGKVKQLTGTEEVRARTLYSKDYVKLRPTWKIFLVSNFDPKTDADDTGLRRRVVAMQFHTIPKDQLNPNLKHVLMTDPAARSAILAWAMRGCLAWQRGGGARTGLGIPETVEASTNQYWDAQDIRLEWFENAIDNGLLLDTEAIANKTVTDSDKVVAFETVYAHYRNWCKDNDAFRVSPRDFTNYMRTKGLIDCRAYCVTDANGKRKQVRALRGACWSDRVTELPAD